MPRRSITAGAAEKLAAARGGAAGPPPARMAVPAADTACSGRRGCTGRFAAGLRIRYVLRRGRGCVVHRAAGRLRGRGVWPPAAFYRARRRILCARTSCHPPIQNSFRSSSNSEMTWVRRRIFVTESRFSLRFSLMKGRRALSRRTLSSSEPNLPSARHDLAGVHSAQRARPPSGAPPGPLLCAGLFFRILLLRFHESGKCF